MYYATTVHHIFTKKCPMCGRADLIKVTKSQYMKYLDYLDNKCNAQDIGLDANETEKLISGTCPTCWDEMFAQ